MRKKDLSFSAQCAWLAGLYEGEGYFACVAQRRSSGALIMALEMTDLDVMQQAKEYLKTSSTIHVCKTLRSGKIPYKLNLNVRESAGWMMMLYPFMGTRRRKQIRQALAEWRTIPAVGLRQCPHGHIDNWIYPPSTGTRVCRTCVGEKQRLKFGRLGRLSDGTSGKLFA